MAARPASANSMTTTPATSTAFQDPEAEAFLWRRPGRLTAGEVFTEFAFLVPREQLLLYSLVFSFAPQRCLEVGVFQGGATRIIHAALSDLGRGCLVGLDPDPKIKIDWQTVADRVTLIQGKSPDDLARAAEQAGGPFDFVFLDGDHGAAGVLADLEGLVGVTGPGAVLLLHDAYFAEIDRALAAAREKGLPYVEGPILSSTANPTTDPAQVVDVATGALAVWGGMRLVWRVEAR